ncbi:S-layer homology domain-containing protein [Fusobacterium sp. MFO224]|uniref:S-layer homology domain-containing protein n=1 Tax=Fusobacterium sp. MFO224 TaxID=3378070 RepID=UPI0038553D41
MKKLRVFWMFLIVSVISFSQVEYKDVSKDHWAYEAIENLVKLGVIEENTFEFKGDKPLTRYEFAYDLSKALNKINSEKADKKELDILTSIVADFSEELNKTGFDRITFEEQLKSIKMNIENLKKQVEVDRIKLETMEKRLRLIERELNLD